MIAVCGMGSPIGCRKSAVTANQSASAPTMPASAAAATYSAQGPAPSCPASLAATYTTATNSSRAVAVSFIRRTPRRRSSSAGVKAVMVRYDTPRPGAVPVSVGPISSTRSTPPMR